MRRRHGAGSALLKRQPGRASSTSQRALKQQRRRWSWTSGGARGASGRPMSRTTSSSACASGECSELEDSAALLFSWVGSRRALQAAPARAASRAPRLVRSVPCAGCSVHTPACRHTPCPAAPLLRTLCPCPAGTTGRGNPLMPRPASGTTASSGRRCLGRARRGRGGNSATRAWPGQPLPCSCGCGRAVSSRCPLAPHHHPLSLSQDSRAVLGLSLAAALNRPLGNTKFGVFRM